MSRSRTFALALLVVAAPTALAQTTERISVSSAGVQGNDSSIQASSITPDGRFIAFQSDASNLVAGDTNLSRDIFVRDRQLGTTTLVSKSSAGILSNNMSFNPSISADGRFVVFESSADNLVAGDTNGWPDIFLHDRASGVTTRVSVSTGGAQSDRACATATISGDGRMIAFVSFATTLDPLATNSALHVFLRNRLAGTTSVAGIAFNGALENGSSLEPSFSADGRFCSFTSDSSNLVNGAGGGSYQVYVRDLVLGTNVIVSRSTAGIDGNANSRYSRISDNGKVVVFQSDASNLIGGDTNFTYDIFTRDLTTNTTELISVNLSGGIANGGSGGTGQPAGISADGRYVSFVSFASDLVPAPSGWTAIYRRDRVAGQTTVESVSSAGIQANNTSLQPNMSADGRFVMFNSFANNLVPGDTNGTYDVFVRGPLQTPWTNLGLGLTGVAGVPNLIGSGTLVTGSSGSVVLSSAKPSSAAVLFLSLSSSPVTVNCGKLVPNPPASVLALTTDSLGVINLPWAAWPAGLTGLSVYFQYALQDAAAPCNVAFSNALKGVGQ